MKQGNVHARNTIYLGLVELFWGAGMNIISMSAILPVMMKDLGATHLEIALLPIIASLGVGIPQILSPRLFGGYRKLKLPLILLHILVTLPLLAAAFMLYLKIWSPTAVMLMAWAVHTASIGMVLPLWLNYMAKILDPAARGRAFGLIFFCQTLAGAIGVWGASHVYGATFDCGRAALLFLFSFFAMFVGTFFFLGTREESFEGVHETPYVSFFALAKKYRWLIPMCSFRWVLRGCYLIISSFYIVDYMESRHGASSAAISIGVFLLLSQAISSFVLGRWGDSVNNKYPVVFSTTAFLGATALMIAGSFAFSYVLLAVALGIYVSSEFTTQNNWMMALAGPGDRHSVLAWHGFLNTAPQIVFPFAGGLVMDLYGMRTVALFVSFFLFAALALMIFFVPAGRDMTEKPAL